MKNSVITLIVFLAPLFSFGQDNLDKIIPKRNTVYVEAFGQGIFNSLSYDRLYRIDKKVKTSVTVGLAIIPTAQLLYSKPMFMFGVPVSYNWLFGKRKSHLELGVGLTLLSDAYRDSKYSETYSYFYVTPKTSYRFQNPNGGLFFRVSFTPAIPLIDRVLQTYDGKIPSQLTYRYFPYAYGYLRERIFPWAGLSLGYTLK